MTNKQTAEEPTAPAYETVLPTDTEDAQLVASDVPDVLANTVEVEEPAEVSAADTEGRLSAWLYQSGQPPRRVALEGLESARAADGGFLWVQIWGYSRQEMWSLAQSLHLNRDAVSITLESWQRPRLDISPDGYFVTATLPRIDAEARRVFAGEVDLFVGRNLLVSAHKQPPVLSKRIRARARLAPDDLRADPSFLVYIILDELIAYYERLGEHVDDEVEKLEERALTDTSDIYLEEVLRLKRYVFALNRLADHHREVFVGFLRPDFPFQFPDSVRPYFSQLHERLMHVLDELADAKQGVNGAFDIYVSRVSHRTNRIIRTLTVISGLLLPITVILTFFSALAQVTPVYRAVGVFLMVALILFAGVVGLWIFDHKQWIHLRPRHAPPPTTMASLRTDDEE